MNHLRNLLMAALVSAFTPAVAGGLPGLRGGDHVGITVPKLDDAVQFFVEIIGCQPFYRLGPFKADSDWMQVHLNVHPRAEIPQLQTLRCGHGLNLELFEYRAPDQSKALPKNSDVGGHHLAFYVDDMVKAVAHLRANGVRILGEPTTMTSGPSAGETWLYFLAPWGMQLELVSYPDGKGYEKDSRKRLWSPALPAN